MADAIPTPAAAAPGKQTPPQSTVLLQGGMSEWAALKEAGWWRRSDNMVIILLAATWMTGFYWKVFGDPETLHLIAFLLITIVIMLAWIISLVFRCSWFVLRLNADVALMPEQSARIAVAYLSGQPAPPPKK
jgi:hypothetical protein